MTILFHNEICLDHFPSDVHPEHPNRYRAAWNGLMRRGLIDRCDKGEARQATHAQLTAVHDEGMIRQARELCATGGGYLESDTPVESRSYDVALWAAGMAVAAVDAVVDKKNANAFCLLRPPGHHATAHHSMGFCLFNNIAVAARHAMKTHHVERILIVDWDVHHGNGTQDIFYRDPGIMFFSSHRHPFYPGSGLASETGTGKGLGYTRNLPISVGAETQEILDDFERVLIDAASASKPQLVLLSAGFDAHYQDPIGGLRLDREHFALMLQSVQAVAREHAQGRLISMLEGGYNTKLLGDLVADHVEGMLDSKHWPS